MARKPATSPRKLASQERSRVTVDALVEATARLLVREGFDTTSTNKIAEQAGVSIGSLYQYFPGKEALVAAVADRHHDRVMAIVREALPQIAAQPFEGGIRRIVALAIEAHRVDPRLHRILTEQVPRTGRLKNVEAFDRENLAFIRAWLEANRSEVRATLDLDFAAFLFMTTVESLTHAAVLHRPESLAGTRAKKFADEVTRLLVAYLR
jgi:AcrR family transcriptional regulator